MSRRIEQDMIGSRELPENAYYGIHTLRAAENFSITGQRLPSAMIANLGWIKKACARANAEAGVLPKPIAQAIESACDELITGRLNGWFLVDPIQGGAGTSTNMNANEVIANRAIELLGGQSGQYDLVNPNDHVNKGQSTNDVYPSCGKMTLYGLTEELLQQLQRLIHALEEKARAFDGIVKMGRTQLQDAVPVRLGQEFAAYAAVLRRDGGRLRRAQQEQLRLNLGGTAIGTGVNAHPRFIRRVVPILAEMTGIAFVQSENLIDATQNPDGYLSLSAALKSCAVSLSKICNDLRLMSSGPRNGLGELLLPAQQNGSSIMPGKVNPVIPEVVNQIAFRIMGFDTTVTLACEAGQLELNAFEPVIFDSLFQGLSQLKNGVVALTDRCVSGIVANEEQCRKNVEQSVSLVTSLCPAIGYKAACALAKEALDSRKPLYDLVISKGLLSPQEAAKALNPFSMTSIATPEENA